MGGGGGGGSLEAQALLENRLNNCTVKKSNKPLCGWWANTHILTQMATGHSGSRVTRPSVFLVPPAHPPDDFSILPSQFRAIAPEAFFVIQLKVFHIHTGVLQHLDLK